MVTTQPEIIKTERVDPFDEHRQQVLLENPGEIVVGDWLRDLGTFRQVAQLEWLSSQPASGPLVVVRFAPQAGVPDLALGITSRVKVTVWRDRSALEKAALTGSSMRSK